MKHKFLLGAVAGMTTLAIAVPLAAQLTSAQSATSSSSTTAGGRPPAFSAESIQSMIDRDGKFLANADSMLSILKSATQKHKDALTAAAALTDSTARKDAVKKAQDDFRATIQAAIEANPDLKGVMMPFGGMGMGHDGMLKGGFGKEGIAQKLGMTPDELKAALDSGKTIEQIAQEKGVTLPVRPAGGRGMMRGHMGMGFGAGTPENDGSAASQQ